MKKKVIIAVISVHVVLIGLIVGFLCYINRPVSTGHKSDRKAITKIIKKEYPEYEIESIELQHKDILYGTTTNAEEFPTNRATMAEAYIYNNDGRLKLSFVKKLRLFWRLASSMPSYGIIHSNVIE